MEEHQRRERGRLRLPWFKWRKAGTVLKRVGRKKDITGRDTKKVKKMDIAGRTTRVDKGRASTGDTRKATMGDRRRNTTGAMRKDVRRDTIGATNT